MIMRVEIMVCAAFLAILTSSVLAQTSAPASSAASAPASASAPVVSEELMKLLKAWQAAGDDNKTLTADIDYKVESSVTGDVEIRTGTTSYQKAGDTTPARFRVQFDTLKTEAGPAMKENVIYAFDGLWLRVLKAKLKQMTRYQVALPGEKIEPLRLGKGPFPLPFGQNADDVLANFNVRQRPAAKSDPADTDHLELIPKTDKIKDFTKLDIWLDKKTHLPAKIVTIEQNKNVSTVVFKNVKAGMELKDVVFSPALPAGWEEIVEPLKK